MVPDRPVLGVMQAQDLGFERARDHRRRRASRPARNGPSRAKRDERRPQKQQRGAAVHAMQRARMGRYRARVHVMAHLSMGSRGGGRNAPPL